MLFDESVEAFDTYLKANRGLSENTRKAYRGDVEECLLALERLGCRNLNEVTIEDLRMWMAESSKKHAKSSMARKTVAVRGFFAWTHEHGVTTTDPACVLMTPKIPDTLPDVLSESQATFNTTKIEHLDIHKTKPFIAHIETQNITAISVGNIHERHLLFHTLQRKTIFPKFFYIHFTSRLLISFSTA